MFLVVYDVIGKVSEKARYCSMKCVVYIVVTMFECKSCVLLLLLVMDNLS